MTQSPEPSPAAGARRRRTAGLAAAVALVSLSAAYLVHKAVFAEARPIDFVFIWWAGELWNDGLNPYGPEFQTIDASIWEGAGNVQKQWFFYPPHWWPIATLSARLPLWESFAAWRILSAACYLGGALIVWRAVAFRLGPISWPRTAGFLAFVFASSATASTIYTGQTSGIVFFGLCLFCAAWLGQGQWSMAAALVLLALKPNFGLAFWVLALVTRKGRISVLIAIGIGLLASLPALLPFGWLQAILGYFSQLGHFSEIPVNAPYLTTGLRTLVEWGSGAQWSPTLVAILGAMASGMVARRFLRRHDDARARSTVLAFVLSLTMLSVTLHSYDATLAAPLILLFMVFPPWAQALVAVGFLIIFRANNLAEATGLMDPRSAHSPAALLLSLAYLLLFAVSCANLLRAASAGRAAGQPGRRGY